MEPQNQQVDLAEVTQRIRYSPLETPQTIRLIHARRSRADGKIIIQMKHFSLPDTRFTAISYVWGEKALHPQGVMINGRTYQVRATVYPILALICDAPDVYKDVWFWIDYLCINQEDVSERSEQVKLMGTLFRTAHRTLVWLGEYTSEVCGALDLLKSFALCSSKSRDKDTGKVTVSTSSEEWKALESLWKRPWWTRIWTLQEFLLPEHLKFYCGEQSISRKDWKRAITSIRGYLKAESEKPASDFDEVPMDHRGFGNQWAWRRLLQWHQQSPVPAGLIALMAYMGHHEATDDRDRVYALLGICSEADRAIIGDPDYMLSVEQVYTRLALNFIRRHQSLDIVCFRALFTEPHSGDSPSRLPSWVPDFRCWVHGASRPVPSMVSEPSRNEIGNMRAFHDPKHGVVDPNLVYDASAGLVAEFSEDEFRALEEGSRLPCHGIILDVIDGLGPVREYETDGRLREYSSSTLVQSTSRANTESRDIGDGTGKLLGSSEISYDIVEHLVRSLSLDRAGRYLVWPAPVEDYASQLRERHLNPVSSHPDALNRFIGANRELCVLGASLLKHLEDLGSRPHASEPPGKDRHSFLDASKMTVGGRSWDCRLITTEKGYLGMAPKQASKGDTIAVLVGCSVPVVLRSSAGEGEYEVVGEAFMPGYMEGEAIHQKLERKDITLI